MLVLIHGVDTVIVTIMAATPQIHGQHGTYESYKADPRRLRMNAIYIFHNNTNITDNVLICIISHGLQCVCVFCVLLRRELLSLFWKSISRVRVCVKLMDNAGALVAKLGHKGTCEKHIRCQIVIWTNKETSPQGSLLHIGIMSFHIWNVLLYVWDSNIYM